MSGKEKHIFTVILGSLDHRNVYGTHEASSMEAAKIWADRQHSFKDYSVFIYIDAEDIPAASYDVHSQSSADPAETLDLEDCSGERKT